jgi:hypothetical protein
MARLPAPDHYSMPRQRSPTVTKNRQQSPTIASSHDRSARTLCNPTRLDDHGGIYHLPIHDRSAAVSPFDSGKHLLGPRTLCLRPRICEMNRRDLCRMNTKLCAKTQTTTASRIRLD